MIKRYYSTSNGYNNGTQKVLFQGGNKPTFGDKVYFRHKASGKIISSIYTVTNYLTITNDLDYPFYIEFNSYEWTSPNNRFVESVDGGETWFIVNESNMYTESQLSDITGKQTILLAGINNTSLHGIWMIFKRQDNSEVVTDNLEIHIKGNLAALGNCNDLSVLDDATALCHSNFTQMKSVAYLSIPARINCTNLFSDCQNLIDLPYIDFSGMSELPAGQFSGMFGGCSSLTTQMIDFPSIYYGYRSCYGMFTHCSNLTVLPRLVINGADREAFYAMFSNCPLIKLSETQDSTYVNEFTITSNTGSAYNNAFNDMFSDTGGTFTGTPVLGTTYYTSNTIYNPPVR